MTPVSFVFCGVRGAAGQIREKRKKDVDFG